jgi:hypothetical protein
VLDSWIHLAANMKGANPVGQIPKDVDLDESARMASRMKIAEFFESRALSQVGITPQRLGDRSCF